MREPNLSRRAGLVWPVLLALVASLSLPGCGGLDRQQGPDLVGPAEQGISVEFVALPDTLNADGGLSYSVIRLVLRDASGKPIPNRAVMMHSDGDGDFLPAPGSTYVGPLQDPLTKVMATDSNGTVFMHYLSGTQRERRVTIDVRPYATDTARQIDLPFRSVEIWQR
jgi:hypothetical protein